MRPHLLALGGIFFAARLFAAEPIDYLKDIKPILKQHCYECHQGNDAQSDLRLDTAAAAMDGGNTGAAIVPGKSGESLLVRRITAEDEEERMPPVDEGEPLSDEQIALVRRWIDEGAKHPADERPELPVAKSDHWAFQPIRRPELPKVQAEDWDRTPIDNFVLARLKEKGIAPSPDADPVTLARRLSLDLTGLPPTLEELNAYLADARPDAYQHFVEQLLASPRYGERWARFWLDQARYADSDGYTNDVPRQIWLYRDWVIAALNRDMPFDEFTIDQIAGDLRPGATPEQIIATGFHRNTQHNREGGSDPEQYRVERVVDRVSTTGTVFLGLTIGCARCHDHKFDPISQRDFYELFAFFDSADEPAYAVPSPEEQAKQDELNAQLAAAESSLRKYDSGSAEKQTAWETRVARGEVEASAEIREIVAVAPEDRDDKQRAAVTAAFRSGDPDRTPLASEVERIKKEQQSLAKSIPSTLVMRERAQPRTTYIHLRGDFLSRGRTVASDTLGALPPLSGDVEKPTRLDLARWLVDEQNPLTARVTMNRLWQVYFGRGIVETDNDFGTQGSPPTHPRLLDYLAAQFISQGWSLKAMHRQIVNSAVYRQSSRFRSDLREIDPRNLLLARQSRHRLQAEVIRDSALRVAGLLSDKMGGPGVYPPQPDGVMKLARNPNRQWVTSGDGDRYRRGLYTYFWRGTPYPFLKTFDAPDSNSTCTRRDRSNTPLQALMLLNDEVFFETAQGLAARTLKEAAEDDADRIRHAFRLCLMREPSVSETQALIELLDAERADPSDAMLATPALARMPDDLPPGEALAWTSVARALLNLDEFMTRE